jgi:hypothetical protein
MSIALHFNLSTASGAVDEIVAGRREILRSIYLGTPGFLVIIDDQKALYNKSLY